MLELQFENEFLTLNASQAKNILSYQIKQEEKIISNMFKRINFRISEPNLLMLEFLPPFLYSAGELDIKFPKQKNYICSVKSPKINYQICYLKCEMCETEKLFYNLDKKIILAKKYICNNHTNLKPNYLECCKCSKKLIEAKFYNCENFLCIYIILRKHFPKVLIFYILDFIDNNIFCKECIDNLLNLSSFF